MICVSALLGLALYLADKFLADYGECNIRINDNISLRVQGGKKLSELLADNKIFLPSSCAGKGTCGHCRVTVKTGAGEILPTEKTLLSRTEIYNNVRLACQIKVKSDISINLTQDTLSAHLFESETEHIRDLSSDLKEIRLRLIKPACIDFNAGQYIQLIIPGTGEQRAYSIVSPQDIKNKITLIVKFVSGGLCSTYIHRKLKKGDKVYFTGPHGSFGVKDFSRDIIFVAGGCGIAPIRSIIDALMKKGFQNELKYFFGARSKENLYFYDQYRRLAGERKNFEFIPVLSHPLKEDNWRGETGFVHEAIEKYSFRSTDYHVYVCGPPVMIESVISVLEAKGFSTDNIFTDNI